MRHAGLDTLRLFAAALVLCAHGGALLYPLLPVYDLYLLLGFVGTELFFALSGFLVVGLLLTTPPADAHASGRFGAARLRRVVPGYWLFFAVNLMLWWAVHADWPPRLWAYPLLLQNAWAPHPPFFGEAWNLPVLVLFSLAAPVMAWWAGRRSDPRRALRNALIGLALAGLAIRSGAVWVFAPEWDAGIRKLLVLRLDACAWGGVLACWMARRPPRGEMTQVAIIGVALLVFSVVLFWALPLEDSGFARAALFTLVALGCALPLPWLCRGASKPRLERAARATWALYLINMPLLQLGLIVGLPALGALPAFALWLLASVAFSLPLARLLARR